MKNVLALVALSLALSLTACTKKEAAVEGEQQQVEGTTSAPSENAAPSEEVQKKEDGAADATSATHAPEGAKLPQTSEGGATASPGSEAPAVKH